MSPATVRIEVRSGFQQLTVATVSNLNPMGVNVTGVDVGAPYGTSFAAFSLFSVFTQDSYIPSSAGTVLKLTCNISVAFSSVLTLTVRAGGMSASTTLYLTLSPPAAVLVVTPNRVTQQAARGRQTLVELTLSNSGEGESGAVSAQLPSNFAWMTIDCLTTSLQPNDQRSLILSLAPLANSQLGRATGNLVITYSSTRTLIVPLSISVVSESTVDSFSVLVQDEYTYFAPGNPPVANATVRLTNEAGDMIQLTTNASGIAQFVNISTGTYQLRTEATLHSPDQVVVEITDSAQVSVFLPRSLVSYTWIVVPTEVQDVYSFTLEATYETYVPAPVVTITPMVLDLNQLEAATTDTQITFVATNWGLINVNNPALTLPTTHPTLQFTILTTPPALIPANSSIVIPVLVSRRSNSTQVVVRRGSGCLTADFTFFYICGGSRSRSIGISFSWTGGCGGGGGGGFGGGGGGGSGGVSFCECCCVL